jgi:ribosome biogenesis protein Tsr3
MPTKKASTAKKSSAAKKPRATRKTSKGDNYICEVCGLSVVVDECGWEEVHEIICCEQPMRRRATRAKAAR